MAAAALLPVLLQQISVDKTVTWIQSEAKHNWPILTLWILFWSAFVLFVTYVQARERNSRPLAPRKQGDGRVVTASELAAIEEIRDLWSKKAESVTGDALALVDQLDPSRIGEAPSEVRRFAADLRRSRLSVATLFVQHSTITFDEAAARFENVLWAYMKAAATIVARFEAHDPVLTAVPATEIYQRWHTQHLNFMAEVAKLSGRIEFAALRRSLSDTPAAAGASAPPTT